MECFNKHYTDLGGFTIFVKKTKNGSKNGRVRREFFEIINDRAKKCEPAKIDQKMGNDFSAGVLSP
jgi:hypothetical protein